MLLYQSLLNIKENSQFKFYVLSLNRFLKENIKNINLRLQMSN